MTIRIRTTEKHPHPIWEKLVEEFPVAEIQGFILSCTDEELINATKNGEKVIPIQCLEAAEYDNDSELFPENIFPIQEWINKINAALFFDSSLLFLTHKPGDSYLFRLHEVLHNEGKVNFVEVNTFVDQVAFIDWWRSIKKLAQSKKLVEAKPRQALTLFDEIIESNGYSWGGNMDGFILTDSNNAVKAIIEVRQSRSFPIEKYDPANYFSGTKTKGGDFKTWLPLVYLKKAYNVPIVLITFSTKSEGKFGFTEVLSINYSKLFYVNDIPPNKNISDDFNVLKGWLLNLMNE
jgi:hypothetical protein